MKTLRLSFQFALSLGLAFILLWIAGVHPRTARAAALCVIPGGAGGCYASIQQAVTAAGDGDTVRVAQGYYTETVVIDKSLILEGGWSADFTIRNWKVYETTIDGQANGPVVRTELPLGVTAIAVTIDGFTLIHGDDSASLGWGGGIQLLDDFNGTSQFTVRNNVISNNTACQASCQGYGGGIMVYGGSAVITDNFIGNNIAHVQGGGRGGGICVHGYAEAILERNVILANTAVLSTTGTWEGIGGGLDLEYAGDATVRDNLIQNNVAALNGVGRGGGIYAGGKFLDNTIIANTASLNGAGYGGGVYAYHVARFDDNTVENNIASKNSDGTGGGIYVVYLQHAANNVIMGNKATRGGGVYYYTYAGDEDFTYNLVSHNSATGTDDATQDGGGGITSAAHGVHFVGNNIRNNTGHNGGGIQIIGGDLYILRANTIQLNTSTYGGGIYVTNAAGTIEQNVIFDNDAVLGGGMYLLEAATPAVEENTIISNTATGFFAAGGGILLQLNDGTTVNLTNNIIAQNAAGEGGVGGGVLCMRGNCNLTHNTIVDNDHGANDEGVILGSSNGGSFILRNNIIAGHSTGVLLLDGAAFSDYNDFFDNDTNLDGVAMGAHDRLVDPQLANRPGGDYHLSQTSPVIDQGIGGLGVAYDFEGDPRPHGAGVDIGADEAYQFISYVSHLTGNDSTGDGSSDHPYATVTKGLEETRANGIVYVGRGQYAEAVSIERNVSLMGGYEEVDWSRDIALYETILDAQGTETVLFIAGDGVYVLIDGFTITGGEASLFGMGGGILVIDNAAATIRHNVITGNHAQNGGGGIAIWGDQDRQSIVEANIIYGNVSEGIFEPVDALSPLDPGQGPEPGGGLFAASPARVVNNMIYGNTAADGGDGLAVGAPGSIQVYHNTIAENGSSDGQGLLIFSTNQEVEIYNNLIIGHGTGISATAPTEVQWDYNGFHGNTKDYAAGLSAGPHDAHGDPVFVDSVAGDYHIGAASAAAGRGSDVGVTTDFDGDARPAPLVSSPDIGADEIIQGRLYLPLIRK